jgi:hypothetical protein
MNTFASLSVSANVSFLCSVFILGAHCCVPAMWYLICTALWAYCICACVKAFSTITGVARGSAPTQRLCWLLASPMSLRQSPSLRDRSLLSPPQTHPTPINGNVFQLRHPDNGIESVAGSPILVPVARDVPVVGRVLKYFLICSHLSTSAISSVASVEASPASIVEHHADLKRVCSLCATKSVMARPKPVRVLHLS